MRRFRRYWTGSEEPLTNREFALLMYGLTLGMSLGTVWGFAIVELSK